MTTAWSQDMNSTFFPDLRHIDENIEKLSAESFILGHN